MVRGDYRKRFRAAVKVIYDKRRSGRFTEENELLHQVIVELADNAQLAALVHQLQLPLAQFQIRSAVDQAHRDHSSAEHDRIIEAVLAGDQVRAGAAMRQHLKHAGKRIMNLDESTFVPQAL